jgi:hypothetical protein
VRIRQIVPHYWADQLLFKELTACEREFYIGLWMAADDAGWLTVDVAELAAELYRYEDVAAREAKFVRQMDHLKQLGRVQVYECGHGLVPNLTRYQRLSGPTKRVYIVRNAHAGCTPPAGNRGDPRVPAGPRPGTEQEQEQEQEQVKERAQEPEREQSPLQEEQRTDLDEVVSLIKGKWNWERVTPKQSSVLVRIADQLAEGSRGFARVRQILEASDGTDPMRVLLDYADSLRVDGEARAVRQERESRRWRQVDSGTARSDLEAIGATLARTRSGEQGGEGVRVLSES